MNHCDIQIDFTIVEDITEIVYDETYASDPNKIEDLKKFCKAFYVLDHVISEDIYFNYRILAIKANNLLGLEVFCQVVSYHDCYETPEYEFILKEAAEFGNLKIFQHCLYAFMNIVNINGTPDIEYSTLKSLAEKNPNPDVLEYLLHLESCIVNDFLICSFYDIDEKNMEGFWSEHVYGNLINNHKLYLKLCRNYETIEERQRKEEEYQQALKTVYKIMITRDIRIGNKYYTGKLYIRDKRLLFEMLDTFNNYCK
jgi:hypothetical protein